MICTCSRSWIVLLSKLGRARDLSENEYITQSVILHTGH